MTDTATPTPESAQRNPGDVKTDPGALTDKQQRRVRALGFARDTLASRGLFSGTDVSKWTTDDLLKLADWILDGSETSGVLFGVAVLPCPGESTRCEPFDPGPVGSKDDEDDHEPPTADNSWMDLPPTGALHENDPPTAGEGLHNPDPVNRPESDLLDATPWRPEPGGESEDDGPSLTEPSGWTDPPATEYQEPDEGESRADYPGR